MLLILSGYSNPEKPYYCDNNIEKTYLFLNTKDKKEYYFYK